MPSFNDFNRKVIEEFRANAGKVGGQFSGAPMLLLTTTGAKTKQQRTTPLVYTTDGRRIVIIASYAGGPKNPAWYHNLLANPEVNVEIGSEKFKALATPASGAERDRLFDNQVAKMPVFDEYRRKTSRQIPVLILERLS